MATYYRGVKVNSDNSNSERSISKGGIYRGIKHGALQNNKSVKNPGIYRGTKTAA
mgnify:FL=1